MGKTPKERVERSRPYNYLRNAQAQGRFSGNETRNHYYSSGSVQRPVAHLRFRPAAPSQFYRGPFRGELYNIAARGRRYSPNKNIVKRAAKQNMQSGLEENSSQSKESGGEPVQQQQQSEEDGEGHNLKNGPAHNTDTQEENEKMKNGLAADTNDSEKAPEQDSGNLDDMNPGPKAKSASKDKKTKKNETASKPKGKQSPKSTKEKKLENTEVKKSEKSDKQATEIEVESKDKKATKKGSMDTEAHAAIAVTQPSIKVMRLNTEKLAANLELNDSSIVEIPVAEAEEKQDAQPSTSSDWPASTRRSPRLQEQKNTQDDSIIVVHKSDDDDSVLVLENESESVTEVSRSCKNVSFGEALISMRGRRSLRALPPLNLSPRLHTFSSSRVPTDQELATRSFSSVFHKSNKSVTTTTSDLAAENDLDDAANSSSTEESGAEIDATASEDVNMSGKRKIPLDEVQHEHKRFRSIDEEQINSSGFLSMISSPMNAFASRIKSGKSSTPVNLVKVSPLPDKDAEDFSDIVKEETDENVEMLEKSEKENLQVALENQSGQEAPQKKWCSIM